MLCLRGFMICLLWGVLDSHSFWSKNVFFENTNKIHTSMDQVNMLLKEVKAHMPRIKILRPSRKTTSLQLLSTDIR